MKVDENPCECARIRDIGPHRVAEVLLVAVYMIASCGSLGSEFGYRLVRLLPKMRWLCMASTASDHRCSDGEAMSMKSHSGGKGPQRRVLLCSSSYHESSRNGWLNMTNMLLSRLVVR
ncbi:uncharacterized protein PgNI_07926 [Pyricularia grisea]|uniref:Uncharacterized protein n=1 Tax=Pyricularia grisea TaxID=148305 RepID=A0A6P8B0W1_PYRGI|nr:uncharacterized protein PgNI_07926 [Pyricularia grisea]TLD08540.1 hypothetical protein PgNI_07926 [Pyricularia grisea]